MELLMRSLLDFSQEEYENTLKNMSDDRRNAILRYRSEKDRKRSVLGEILAREGISKLCGVESRSIIIKRTEAGKPYAPELDIHFSISHSKDMVVCAVSYENIGADVERVRDIDLRILSLAGTEGDREFIYAENLSDEERRERFFKLWTAKEAYFKFCGTGIVGLKSINYLDIAPKCEVFTEGEYMITIYREDIKNP